MFVGREMDSYVGELGTIYNKNLILVICCSFLLDIKARGECFSP